MNKQNDPVTDENIRKLASEQKQEGGCSERTTERLFEEFEAETRRKSSDIKANLHRYDNYPYSPNGLAE